MISPQEGLEEGPRRASAGFLRGSAPCLPLKLECSLQGRERPWLKFSSSDEYQMAILAMRCPGSMSGYPALHRAIHRIGAAQIDPPRDQQPVALRAGAGLLAGTRSHPFLSGRKEAMPLSPAGSRAEPGIDAQGSRQPFPAKRVLAVARGLRHLRPCTALDL
jgi:hypothetical protein